MFSDRRAGADRRKQSLSMPAGMNRRKSCRRDRNFHSKPWWLKIDYSVEITEDTEGLAQSITLFEPLQAPSKPGSNRNKA